MKIACVSSTTRGEIDRVLSDVATQLQAAGVVLTGIVKQQRRASGCETCGDMSVRVLPDGPVIRITQDLGKGSDACRLDPGGIAEAVSCVERQPMDGAALFILNKFGPEEASGRGFVSAIGTAMEFDVPVLVGVGAGNLEAFETFAGGLADVLPADPVTILAWCRDAAEAKTGCEANPGANPNAAAP